MSEIKDQQQDPRAENQNHGDAEDRPDESVDRPAGAEDPAGEFDPERPGRQPEASAPTGGAGEANEVEILRGELRRLQEELEAERNRSEEMRDRFMRARADLENYRKRALGDVERAREAGLDSAVLPVLSVFDDLQRALDAADGADPARIVPGVQSVLATLERNLEALGVKPVGRPGEAFDPDIHEALTSQPTDEADKADTIAEVFQLGFQKGDRLIRPARVVVYQS